MPKKYKIEKLTDILDIPVDSIDDFLIDLKSWHEMITGIRAVEGVMNIPEGQIALCESITWTDDKKHDIHIKLTEVKK